MQITIPYKPRLWAIEFHDSKERWKVLVIHRRGGKTTASLNHLQRDALQTPNSRWAYIAPTYKQAKFIAWDLLKQYSRMIPGIEYNESELTVRYPNGAKLTLFGADNPDSLRGMGFWGVVFDEYSQQPSNIFTEIIRPALADHGGYAIWIGTPKGKNAFWRLYAGIDDEGKQVQNINEWYRKLLTVQDTSIINERELEDSKSTMTRDEYQQEWYCSFDAAIKGAIYAGELEEMRADGRIRRVPWDKAIKVHTVWDLGTGANMAIGFYQTSFGDLKKIDYWEGSAHEGLPEAIREVLRKPYVYGKHFAPHDIEATEISTGRLRIDTARELGIGFTVIPKLSPEEGIHMAKLAFPHLWVDESRCSKWLDAIAQYRRKWDEKRGMFLDEAYHDWTSHGADEWRYAAVVEEQMTNDDQESWVINTEARADPY